MRRTATLLAGLLLAAAAACSSTGDGSPNAEASDTPLPPTSAVPTPSPSLSLSPECRTWIKAELLDNSEEIDSTAGYKVCGALSDEDLSAAIEQVTDELSAEITPEP